MTSHSRARETMAPAKASSLSEICLLIGMILNVGSVAVLSTAKIGKASASTSHDIPSLWKLCRSTGHEDVSVRLVGRHGTPGQN